MLAAVSVREGAATTVGRLRTGGSRRLEAKSQMRRRGTCPRGMKSILSRKKVTGDEEEWKKAMVSQ